MADEDVSPTPSPALLQPPSPKTPPTDGAGFKSPAHKSLVGVTGVTEVSDEVEAAAEVNAVSTPELKLEESQRSSVLSAWEQERVYLRCVRCSHVFTDSDWSQFKSEGWDVEIMKLCIACIDSMIEHE